MGSLDGAEHLGHREAVDVGVEHARRRSPAWASAMARLTVTEDLPTPPLPEEIPSTRVLGELRRGSAARARHRGRARRGPVAGHGRRAGSCAARGARTRPSRARRPSRPARARRWRASRTARWGQLGDRQDQLDDGPAVDLAHPRRGSRARRGGGPAGARRWRRGRRAGAGSSVTGIPLGGPEVTGASATDAP